MTQQTLLKYRVSTSQPPGEAVTINSSWLSGKTAPYQLGSPDDTGSHDVLYALAQDITVDHGAFWCGFEGSTSPNRVTLDLNGYTITYNNADQVTVTNGGFESSDLSGWTIPGEFSRVAASQFMFGGYMLESSSITSAKEIISPAITVTAVNRAYVATAWIKAQSSSSTARMYVLRSSDSTVLATGPLNDGAHRGFTSYVEWSPTAEETIKIKIVVTPPGGGDTFWVDEVALSFLMDPALWASKSQTNVPAQYSGISNFTDAARLGAFVLTDSTVTGDAQPGQDGAIVQADKKSHVRSHVLYARGEASQTASKARFYLNGIDCLPIASAFASGVDFEHNYIGFGSYARTTRRMGILEGNDPASLFSPCAIYASTDASTSQSASCTISDNTIVDCPYTGMTLGSYAGSTAKTISGNSITMNSTSADAYGIATGHIRNIRITGNDITAGTGKSGRGIFIETSGTGYGLKDVEVDTNTISVRERYNLEYTSSGLECTGIRLRIYPDKTTIDNVRIHDNTVESRTGATGETAVCFGVRVKYNGTYSSPGIQIYGNDVKAIAEAAGFSAAAYGIDTADSGSFIIHRGNTWESNHTSMNLTDSSDAEVPDSYIYDLVFMNETAEKSSEYTGLFTHVSIRNGDGYSSIRCRNVSILNQQYSGGAPAYITWDTTGWNTGEWSTINTGFVLDVHDSTPSAAVVVRDKDANLEWSTTADGSGRSQYTPSYNKITTHTKGDDPEETEVTVTPLTVYYDSENQNVTPTANQEVVF